FIRVAALLLNGLLIVLLTARPLARLIAPTSMTAAANEVERRQPAFRERLQTITSRAAGSPASTGSRDMLHAVADQIVQEIRGKKPDDLLPWGPALRAWI